MYPVKHVSGIILALLAIFWATAAPALSTDKNQPIEIEADSVDIDESKGISTYKGNVELNQGSMRLQADKVTVHHSGSKPQDMVAVGKPVKFRQLPDNSKEYVKARGNKMEYEIAGEEVILTGNAVLIQGKDTFKSDRIVYDRVKAVIKGGAAAKGKERVRITIQPKKQP